MRKTRQQSFRNQAERGIVKAREGVQAISRAAERYRGDYTPGDANLIVQLLKAELAVVESKLLAKEPTPSHFAWPS